MTEVLITGANGFVGKVLCRLLLKSGYGVRAAVRSESASAAVPGSIVSTVVGDINAQTDWREALAETEVVIHLAARVHVMAETASDPLAAFQEVNTAGTENLAMQAAAAGVKRMIYISTIKVNGEQRDRAFAADDKPAPKDPYAVSKWEAEQLLQHVSADTGMEIVIIRPPLVYGPGVKGNFQRLFRLIHKGFPLPLGKVSNKRSMVNVDNLCDLIQTCIGHAKAQGEVFLVSDDHDLSTPDLVRLIAQTLSRPLRLIPIPQGWLYKLGGLIGKEAEIERLCGTLLVDIRKTKQVLGWQPPYSVAEGIKKTLAEFR